MTKQTGIERYTVKELRDILGTVYGATLKSYDRKPALLAMLAWRIERDHEMALIIDRQMRRVVDVEEAREQAWIEHELRQSSEAAGYVVTWDDVQRGRELNIARAHDEALEIAGRRARLAAYPQIAADAERLIDEIAERHGLTVDDEAAELNRIEAAQYESTGFAELISRAAPGAGNGADRGEKLYLGALDLAHAEALREQQTRTRPSWPRLGTVAYAMDVDRGRGTEYRPAPLPGPRIWPAVVAPQLHPVG